MGECSAVITLKRLEAKGGRGCHACGLPAQSAFLGSVDSAIGLTVREKQIRIHPLSLLLLLSLLL